MKLDIPPKPPILLCSDREWQKWFAFFFLPISHKSDLIDQYPALLIERPHPDPRKGTRPSVYFNPDVFDTQVPYDAVMRFWDRVVLHEGQYPRQKIRFDLQNNSKEVLFRSLDSLNYAVLAHRYRYVVRPENYFFIMDFEQALMDATTPEELLLFYAIV